jgi:3-oxoacyl-[acyl-carrier-protein] synthase-1
MTGAVHIVAAGARTPVGLTAEATAAAVRAGISRLTLHPFVTDHDGEAVRMALDGRLDPAVRGSKRLAALVRSAVDEVLAKLNRVRPLSRPPRLLLALPEARPGFSDADARALLSSWPPRTSGVEVQVAGRGHAGGLDAVEKAAQAIARRELDVCLVAGVDTYLETDTLEWLQKHRQLATEETRNGFNPGEGAAALALASDDGLRHFGLSSLAMVRGVGTACETKLIKSDDINLGEGLTQAVQAATRGLKGPGEAVNRTYCDINGERYRTEEWSLTVLRTQSLLGSPAYVAPADCWGDVGAASGPLLCNLAVQAWARRYAPGPRALVWASSEGGLRGAAVLQGPANG